MSSWFAKTVVPPLAAVALLLSVGSATAAEPSTLRVELVADIDYVDPALSFYVPAWTIEYATCAKLLNYPDSRAPRGALLEPEVARGMPAISADGRTYTFHLRDDFFFSPPSGVRVTAAHFKWAIDRALNRQMNSPAQPYFSDIVGATDVIAGTTNSTSGVLADGGKLAITLVRPAGDFLSRLAMPFACPLPLDVLVDPDGIEAPVPSAGPYYVDLWARNQEVVLKENPNYRGTRPHHFDEIHYGIGLPLETIKERIDQGTADWGDIPPTAHAELATRFGPCAPTATPTRQRYLCFPAPAVLYLAMNHDRPLFGSGGSLGNVALKQAVNLAIDRTALIEQRGANAGRPTDQLVPFEVAGFRDADIYPFRPDLARARELAGCTGNTPDTCPQRQGVFYCSNRAPAPQQCQIVQANLREIGLELEIKLFPRAMQFELAGRRGEPFDLTLEAWFNSYLDPYGFLSLLDGTTIRPANNVNFAYFNDPVFNGRIAAANALVSDARLTAFADLDEDLMRDAAPWAPFGVPNDRYYFSDRVGCQTYSPAYTIDLAALCIRPAISIDDVVIQEGDMGSRTASFAVKLTEAAPGDYPVSVDFATFDGTAGGSDYAGASGTLTFAPGELTKTVDVRVEGDTADEADETFVVRLSNAGKGTIVRSTGTGTIIDDDQAAPQPQPQPPPAEDTQAPANPSLSSTSHRVGVRSVDRTVDIVFSGASDDRSGVDGFSFAWDRRPDTVPDLLKDAEEVATGTTSPPLENGNWYIHLRTRDNAGNWSATAHLGPFLIVGRPPCVVPDLRGKTIGRARTLVAAKHCGFGRVRRAYAKRIAAGRTMAQSPRPHARLPNGTPVHVVVSRGRRR
jgi:peptide/nickel transport system substrate-binding protein